MLLGILSVFDMHVILMKIWLALLHSLAELFPFWLKNVQRKTVEANRKIGDLYIFFFFFFFFTFLLGVYLQRYAPFFQKL